jgi:hypothetical protein
MKKEELDLNLWTIAHVKVCHRDGRRPTSNEDKKALLKGEDFYYKTVYENVSESELADFKEEDQKIFFSTRIIQQKTNESNKEIEEDLYEIQKKESSYCLSNTSNIFALTPNSVSKFAYRQHRLEKACYFSVALQNHTLKKIMNIIVNVFMKNYPIILSQKNVLFIALSKRESKKQKRGFVIDILEEV